MAALYRYVPNAPVRRSHAWAGAIFAGVGIEAARHLLAFYWQGADVFAGVRCVRDVSDSSRLDLLVWIIVLLGAVFTAYMPSLLAGTSRRPQVHGWQFQLAIEVLRELDKARGEPGMA